MPLPFSQCDLCVFDGYLWTLMRALKCPEHYCHVWASSWSFYQVFSTLKAAWMLGSFEIGETTHRRLLSTAYALGHTCLGSLPPTLFLLGLLLLLQWLLSCLFPNLNMSSCFGVSSHIKAMFYWFLLYWNPRFWLSMQLVYIHDPVMAHSVASLWALLLQYPPTCSSSNSLTYCLPPNPQGALGPAVESELCTCQNISWASFPQLLYHPQRLLPSHMTKTRSKTPFWMKYYQRKKCQGQREIFPLLQYFSHVCRQSKNDKKVSAFSPQNLRRHGNTAG